MDFGKSRKIGAGDRWCFIRKTSATPDFPTGNSQAIRGCVLRKLNAEGRLPQICPHIKLKLNVKGARA